MTMPDYYGDRYTEMNRQLAMRERGRKREMRGSSAAQGTLYSGHTAAQARDIEAQTGEEWHAGARDIEDRRWRGEQDELARKWQTSERMGSQEWKSGESEAERTARMKLQSMADAERYRLQQLVNSGQMDLQEAEQKWSSFEADLNRQLEWETTKGGWEQEQWGAIFGANSAMALQNDTQGFEEYMAKIGRDWELSDRTWEEQMFLMDAQLQMLVAGYDWLTDEYGGGTPSWMVEDPEKPGTPPSEGTGYTTHPYAAEAPEDLPPSMQAAYDTLTPEQQAQFWATAPQWREWYLNFYGRA